MGSTNFQWRWFHYWLSSILFLTLDSKAEVSRELVFDIFENVPEGTLIGLIRGPSPPYLIVGVDSGLTIDQSNGEIRTKIKLDREIRDTYSFVAIPINGDGVRVVVHVKDTNDNAPTFASDFMSVEFPENTPRDVKRTLQPAKDKDLGLFNTQRYVISGGNVNNAFRLSSHRERDGVLYLDLQVNGFLDRETTPFYNLVIDAFDGGVPPLRGSMTVHVSLTDVNDNSPIFNQSRYFATISENATIGTSVLQVFATDTDSGPNGQVSYAINRRQTDKESIFKIDPFSGVISVNRGLDFESKEVHELVVIAKDNGIQALETTIFVSIRVIDVNDHQPLISLVFLTEDASPKVSEGALPGEYVARISVHDPDSKQEYPNVNISLSGTHGHFGLAKRNGVVYIVTTSKVIDREKYSEYSLTVVATDPGIPTLNTSITFRLQIQDVNDNPPIFEEEEYYSSVLEVSEPGTSVLQVIAMDADLGNNSVVSYELVGVPGSASHWFRIDQKTGLVTTTGVIDCETDPLPRLTVIARDHGTPSLSTSAMVYVQIRDVNDNEPLFDQSFYNVSVPENSPVGRCILKVSATDPDCGINAIVNYTIRENNSKRLPLSVNVTTGELCVSGALDYEERSLYEIYLLASDAGGLSSTAIVRIQLLDVNDNDPIFYPKHYETTVSEDAKPGFLVVTVKATDPDKNSKLLYSITEGNTGNHFSMTSSENGEGRISIKNQLSGKSGRKLSLQVKASDNDGRASVATVIVNVAGLNNRGLIFQSGRYNFSILEDTPLNSIVGSVSASASSGGKVRYSISSGDPHSYFTIDLSSGILRTANPLDHEKYSSLLLNIQATTDDPSGFTHAQVEVNIVDVNDNRPEFEGSEMSIWVPESAEVGSIIYRATAIDKDYGEFGRVQYSLLEGSKEIFEIDSKRGQISLRQALDYESIKRYTLVIGARDSGSPPRVAANFTVSIEVQDVNDNGPVFDRDVYVITISEGLPLKSHVTQVEAMDEDTGNNARISYNLSQESELEGVFGVYPNNGLIYLKAPLDRETKHTYTLRLVAIDHGLPPLSTTTTVAVTISDENDNDPKFPKSLYSFTMEENNEAGSLIGRVEAIDRDISSNGEVRYFLQPIQRDFEIDSIQGTITATTSLDREKQSLYELQVVGHDQGLPQRLSEVIVHISVSDVNDCVPLIIEPNHDRIIVREEQPIGTEVTKILATDGDNGENSSLIYSIVNDGYSGGSEFFSIDPITGLIRTKTMLKYEKRSFYSLTVQVRDNGNPPLETIQNYRIEVVELDDSAQIFSRSKFSFKVSEKATIGQFVGTVRIAMEDHELHSRNARTTFVIVRGNSDGSFELDKSTGGILVGKKLDYELTTEYNLHIRVMDNSLGYSRDNVLQVTIHVTDENDEKPMFPKDPVYFSIPEDRPIGSALWNFTAVDLDNGPNGIVHYSIVSQEPSEKFRMNTLTGTLYLQETLDYEAQTQYLLVVMAGDQAIDITKRLNSTITVQISIDDRNDKSPSFVSSTKVSVVSGAESWIHTVIAVDEDSGVNGQVTYKILSGNEAGYFELDKENGHLSLVKSRPSNLYTLNLSATDQGSPPKVATQLLQIKIEERTTQPPRFSEQKYETKVQENALLGTQIIKLTAILPTQRPNNTFIYILPEGIGNGKFGIHRTTGSITVTGLIDREIESDYSLTVYVHNSYQMSQYDTTIVHVRVIDVNDNSPKLTCTNIRVPENQELGVVHTFPAIDPDSGRNGEVSYSITSGNYDNMFSIDLHSGQFKSRSLDRERKAVYNLVITAQDQGLPVQRTSCNVSVVVTDENDNSPMFYESQYSAFVAENSLIGSTVLVVEASDADMGINSAITYSLNNASHWHFAIDNRTGAIIVAGRLDREKLREYIFEVVATDGGLYDSRSSKAQVRITLTDVNDNRPQFTQNPNFIQISPHSKLGQNVLQLKAGDKDEGLNGDISYQMETQTTKFRIHGKTGVVTVSESLSIDDGKIYQLVIVAKDQGNPSLSTNALVVIQIGDVPVSNMLRFTESKYQVKIYENSASGTDVLQVTALRNDGRRQKILYSIFGGNENEGFEIVPSTGQIRVQNGSQLDREELSNFSLIISAKTEGTVSLYAHTVVQIILLDENDSSPRFTQDLYMAAVWEGNSKGAFAIQVSGRDADEGPNANLIYYIVDGNEDNAFVIEPAYSGIVKTNIVLDREIQDKYRLTIIATDEGSPQMTGSCLLQINVIDVNDNLPTFPPHSIVSTSEESIVGSHVTTMVGNDVDTNPELLYSFTIGGNPGEFFSIGKYDGRILLVKPLDYEEKAQHFLQVQVSDSVHSAFTNLTVNVLDANDNPPIFSEPIYEIILSDNREVGSNMLEVKATDLDSDANGRIKYSLIVPKNEKSRTAARGIWIDESSGIIYTNSSAVWRKEATFVEITILATDYGKPTLSSKATLWLQIQPSEFNLIKFTTDEYTVDVRRDMLPGARILKLEVDYDHQLNKDVQFRYSFSSEIRAENSNSLFVISSDTGEILLARRLSYEDNPNYKLNVIVTCVSIVKCSASTIVLVTMKEVDDTQPRFNESSYKVTVSEKKSVGSILLRIQPISSTNETPPSIIYDILSGLQNPKTFDMNPKTGGLTLQGSLDFETIPFYKLVIRGRTRSHSKSWTLLTVEVEVEDANDNSPHFPLASYLEFVPENESVGTVVFVARAIDNDAGVYGKLNYSILESSAKEKFSIHPTTGVVSTKTVFDYETMSRFHFTLRASDLGGLATTSKVLVEIESRDEYEPQFTQKSYGFVVPSNAGVGHVVGTVRAIDEDQGPDGFVQYTISQQNGRFRINRTTGIISLKQSLSTDFNTSIVLSAGSGAPGSKSTTVIAEILIGGPSAELGSVNGAGVSDWMIGLAVIAVLFLFAILIIFLVLHLRQKKGSVKGKPDESYEATASAFDTLEYAQSTMLAGASSRPTSLYSPQYSDLSDLGMVTGRRRLTGNAASSELSEKSNSASSGRGSAEEGEEVEDEEIRMINEGRLAQQKLRDSIGIPDSGIHEDDACSEASSVKNTQEYLARLGIRPKFPEDGSSGKTTQWVGSSHQGDVLDMPLDISTLIYAQIPDDEDGGVTSANESSTSRHERVPTHQASVTGSLSSILHNGEEELTGSYNWDYLQHWGPQYQPLAHVFSEIARLNNEDVSSNRSESHYSGVHSVHGGGGQGSSSEKNSESGLSSSIPSVRTINPSASASVVSGSSSKHNSHHLHPRLQQTNSRGGPLPALPILPRSPITQDPSFTSPLSPSFSPELSFCSSLPGIADHSLGIRTSQYPPTHYSSDSSEIRM